MIEFQIIFKEFSKNKERVELFKQMSSNPRIAAQEIKDLFGINLRILKRISLELGVVLIYDPTWFLEFEKLPILDWYFEDKLSTTEIAKKIGCTQPTIFNYLNRFRASDPRFDQVKQGTGLAKKTVSPGGIERTRKALLALEKIHCKNCEKSFSPMSIRRHEDSCETWPRCEVCKKVLSKRVARFCLDHLYNHR